VCCPLLIDGRLVTELAHGDGPGGLVIAYEFAEGRPPDPANVADAEQMGGALAALHASMSRLGPADLPPVYALRTSHARGQGPDWQPHQLLHGDFQSANLRKTSDGLRIFDLEDCGYGPVLFEVANSLYMVLFDSIVQSTPNVYGAFRPAFVAGYVAVSGISLSDAELDRYIDLRVDALAEWLGDLASAPPGIRNASAEWLATLQRFVANYRFPPA
jgi:Ser/Thr protein kinase RdoA (MazF antagonist)